MAFHVLMCLQETIQGVPENNAQNSIHNKFGTVCRKMEIVAAKFQVSTKRLKA